MRPTLAVIFICLVMLIIFGSGTILSAKRSLNAFLGKSDHTEVQLQEQNDALKAQLTQCVSHQTTVAQQQTDIVAAAYAAYPFNIKDVLTIAAGSNNGIYKNDAVVENGILIGQVTDVQPTTSVVRTVFDPNWEFPVRIGTGVINALFHGGPQPALTLIPKETPPATGDSVIAAFNGMPYGIPMGTIEQIKNTDAEPFIEATLAVPYNMNHIIDVTVILSNGK